MKTICAQIKGGDLPLVKSIQMFEEEMRCSSAGKKQLEASKGIVRALFCRRGVALAAEPLPSWK